MHSIVEILLGQRTDAQKYLTCTVPLGFQKNGTFFVDTSTLGNTDDVKCDDNGGWLNSGVRKLWLSINSEGDNLQSEERVDNDAIMSVQVVQRGGQMTGNTSWCLIRSYFKNRCAEDFRKVITTLLG